MSVAALFHESGQFGAGAGVVVAVFRVDGEALLLQGEKARPIRTELQLKRSLQEVTEGLGNGHGPFHNAALCSSSLGESKCSADKKGPTGKRQHSEWCVAGGGAAQDSTRSLLLVCLHPIPAFFFLTFMIYLWERQFTFLLLLGVAPKSLPLVSTPPSFC